VVWGEYGGVLRQAILALKHGGRDELADPLAARLAALVAVQPWCEEIDAVAAVPSHPVHRFRRGFTAAGLLAAGVARRLHTRPTRVLRRRGLGRQAGLSRSRRRRLARDRFRLRSAARVRKTTVLLVDDVTTTGTTLRRAADVLCEGGAHAVYCAALAWVADPRSIG
jgi:ComF family protein